MSGEVEIRNGLKGVRSTDGGMKEGMRFQRNGEVKKGKKYTLRWREEREEREVG